MAEGPAVPSWVWNPRRKVLGIIFTTIATGVGVLSGHIIGAWDAFIGSIAFAGISAGSAFADLGDALLMIPRSISAVLIDFAANGGPLAGPLVAVGFAVVILGIIRLADAAIEIVDVPIINLGPLVDAITGPFRWIWGLVT